MFACIFVPDFPVAAIVRPEPLLREHAVAVLEGKPPLTRVVAVNEKARLLGLEAGMTKMQAGAFAGGPATTSQAAVSPPRSPDRVLLRERSREQESSAHSALLDVAHSFTPRVEDTADDTLLLDLAGLERLYGAPGRMAAELSARVAMVGVDANLALAANPDAAMHAARGFAASTVIPAGKEAQRLGVLPISILLEAFHISSPRKLPAREGEKLREQILDTLERWGVRDFRMLGLLPEHALASRLGETGVKLRRLALGEGLRTLALCEPSTELQESMELEFPVETIESLSFVLNRLLDQLCTRLQARALAAQELRLRLQLEHRVGDEETTSVNRTSDFHPVVFERILRLPVAMRDTKVFLKLLQLDLAAYPPGAPVTKVSITAEPALPRSAQRGLFMPITPEAEKLEVTLARINAVVGQCRAGIARLVDSHRPDSFHMERFAVAADDAQQRSTTMSDTQPQPPLAVRSLRPARRLRVDVSHGRPSAVLADKRENPGPELNGEVLWSAGPWRSSGDWWADTSNPEHSGPWDREEWDVAVLCGTAGEHAVALYRIYRDVGTGDWFADASYD